jgi:hypothetical protein
MTYFEQLTENQVEYEVKIHTLSSSYEQIMMHVLDPPRYQVRDQIQHQVWNKVEPVYSIIEEKIDGPND